MTAGQRDMQTDGLEGEHTITLVEGQVDYLSASAADSDRGKRLYDLAGELIADELTHGAEYRQFSSHGYMGDGAQMVSRSRKPDSWLVNIVGELADRQLQAVSQLADNISRLDVQATLRLTPEATDLATRAWERVAPGGDPSGLAVDYQLDQHSKGGQTLYVGAPTSDLRGRLYNKAKQDERPVYEGCWRWELQCRRGPALSLGRRLAALDERHLECAGVVGYYFRNRGIAFPAVAPETEWQALTRHVTSDAHRRLAWLGRSVRPVIRRLEVSGHGTEALAILSGMSSPKMWEGTGDDREA